MVLSYPVVSKMFSSHGCHLMFINPHLDSKPLSSYARNRSLSLNSQIRQIESDEDVARYFPEAFQSMKCRRFDLELNWIGFGSSLSSIFLVI